MSSLLRGARACLSQFTSRVTLTTPFIKTRGACGPQIPVPWSRCMSNGMSQNQVDSQRSPTNYRPNDLLEPLTPIDRQLEVMDSHARWRGRIDREAIEEVLKLVKTEGNISEQQSLMLLRCTGALMVKESPSDRLKIFSEIWNQLKAVGVPLRTSHFNASLRIQLENKASFSPSEMLAQMEASPSTKPNRITFQLLVARFCEEGDVEGASKVLEHMKNEKMAINETVFNSLVKGHLKNGDIEGARSVLDSMRSVGVDPTADSYCVLMCCQAEKGDLDGLKETQKLAAEDEVTLLPRHYYATVMELADNGFQQVIPEVLGMLPEENRFNHDTLNCMHQLMARGHDQIARLLLDQLSGDYENDTLMLSGSRSLLRDMILKNRPVETIEEMLEDLRAAGRTTDDMGYISILALQYKKPELALSTFEVLKKADHPVRPHFFWPIFIMYRNAGNKEAIYAAAGIMVRLIEKDSEVISSLYVNVFNPLQEMGDDPTTIVTKLQEQGISMDDCNCVQLLHLISSGKVTEAATLVGSISKGPSQAMLRLTILNGVKANQDMKGYIQLLSGLQNLQNLGSMVKFNSDVLQSLTKSSSLGSSELTELVQSWVTEGLTIGSWASTNIKEALRKAGVSDEVVETLTSVTMVTRAKRAVISSTEAMGMTVEDLEEALDDRGERKSFDALTLQKWLLSKYCSSGNIEKAAEMKAKLDAQGFVYRADMLRKLAILAGRHKKDLDEAIKYKEELEAKYPEYPAYTGVTINIATLQVEQGKTNEALETLRAHAKKHQLREGQQDMADAFQFSQHCTELLEASRKEAPAGYTDQLVSTLFDGGYIKNGSYSLLEQAMKAYLEKGDVEEVMTYLEQCHVQYGRTPMFNDVFRMLIKLEDAEKLQKAVDMVTTVFGEMPVLHHLVLAFIECGKVKQARKILDTPGLRAVMVVLQSGCDRFITRGKEEELKQLVDMTRDLFAIDRDEMLFSLIKLYARQNNPPKVLDVLATYEDEGCFPSNRTLRYVAKVLQAAGHEVPFTVPEVARSLNVEDEEPANPFEKECLGVLKSGDTGAVLEQIKSAEGAQTASPRFLAGAGRYMLKKGSRKDFKQLVYILGEQGQCEALEILQKDNMSQNMGSFVNQRLLKARIQSDQVSELFADPGSLSENMTTAAIQLLSERHPHLLSQLEATVEQDLAKPDGHIKVANQLFNFYILSDQFDKASDLLKKSSHLKAALRIRMAADQLGKQANEPGLLNMLDVVADLSPGKRAVVFGQLIHIRTNADDTEGALNYLNKAKESGINPTSLWPLAMDTLEQQLIAENKPVPFEARADSRPQRPSGAGADDTVNDSSDSSDSDAEQGDAHNQK